MVLSGPVLILGCGYLGRRLASRWRAQGREVWATTRSAARAEELRGLGLRPMVCDVLDRGSLLALPLVGTMIHCVGFDRAAGKSLREVYVDGLTNLRDAVLRRGLAAPAVFVHVGSTGVYGQQGGEEADEDAATEPEDESGRVVLEAERLLRDWLPSAILLRFAGIYGPRRLIGAQALRAGTPLTGDPERWLNLIHVEDGAAAVAAAVERGRRGRIYNVSDGRPVRRRDFYTKLAELLGVRRPDFGPSAPGAPQERANRRIVNRRLLQELGLKLQYPSFEEGLPASVREEGAGA
jgi:nucleoside-diphosphate-sugar epimerase